MVTVFPIGSDTEQVARSVGTHLESVLMYECVCAAEGVCELEFVASRLSVRMSSTGQACEHLQGL